VQELLPDAACLALSRRYWPAAPIAQRGSCLLRSLPLTPAMQPGVDRLYALLPESCPPTGAAEEESSIRVSCLLHSTPHRALQSLLTCSCSHLAVSLINTCMNSQVVQELNSSRLVSLSAASPGSITVLEMCICRLSFCCHKSLISWVCPSLGPNLESLHPLIL